MIKAVMLYFGNNMMASDRHLSPDFLERNKDNRKARRHSIAETRFLFDYGLWKEATDLMRRGGLNTVLVELNEGVVYPSHPELAVEGSWEPSRLQDELKRLRKMGLDPIPKLNFSTTHCAWQKEWRRKTSTPEYYRFCSDIVGDVCDIFEKPSHFHIGMDEEWPDAQPDEPFVICRQGDLWLHDARFLVDEIQKHGVRPMMWSDIFRKYPKEFQKVIPKSVLVQNWYYSEMVDEKDFPKPINFNPIGFYTYGTLEKAGYDQLPTCSNWCGPKNMGRTIRHCVKTIAPERLKGFMAAPWKWSIEANREAIMTCIAGFIGACEGAGFRSEHTWHG